MRDYAKISPLFWTRGSGKKLRGKPNAQVVAFYLVTCPASNMIGIYYQPLVTIAHETGLSIDDTRIALGECALADFAHYDEDAEMVWVPNMASYQIGDELKPGDKRRGAVLAELGRVDGHRFADEFRVTYGNGYGIEGASKALRRGRKGAGSPFEGIARSSGRAGAGAGAGSYGIGFAGSRDRSATVGIGKPGTSQARQTGIRRARELLRAAVGGAA